MTEHHVISLNTVPKYQSTVVIKNDDETYEVTHIFVDEEGSKISVKYPRVKITIDATIDPFDYPRVFPYGSCQVLPFGENEELFELTVKD